jgi:hypothetical protein
MSLSDGDGVLRQRCIAQLDMSRGGWMHIYDIVDGEEIVDSKTVTAISRNSAAVVSYTLGDRDFRTVAEFMAAYRMQKAAA